MIPIMFLTLKKTFVRFACPDKLGILERILEVAAAARNIR